MVHYENLPEQIVITDLLKAKKKYPELLPDCTAENGLFIYVPDNLQVELPLHVIFSSNDLNVVIYLGKHSRLQVIQEWEGSTNAQYNCHIQLSEFAQYEQIKLQNKSIDTEHQANYNVIQAANSRLHSQSLSLGAAIANEMWGVYLQGEKAHCECYGLVIVNGTQRATQQLIMHHLAPYCSSSQQFKAIATDKARALFNGKVVVQKSGFGAKADQHSQNLLLSAQAEIGTRPELEVYTDDVKASHGATVGQLDADSLFFLRARGIPLEQAQLMLLNAFIETNLENLAPNLRSLIAPMITQKLSSVRQV